MTKNKKVKPILNASLLSIEKIVVVDQSYTHPGFSVWNLKTGSLLNFQDFTYPKKATNREKRAMQAITVSQLVEMFRCNAVIVEEPRMFPSAYTKARLHEIIASISDSVSIPVYMANTTAWKAITVGHRATKEETVQYVARIYNAIVDDDIADAICIGEAVLKGVSLKRFD